MLETSPRQLVTLDLADFVRGLTTFKRRAVVVGTATKQNKRTGEFSAAMSVDVEYYAATETGEFGDYMATHGMPDKPVTLDADNDTVVDAQTGRLLLVWDKEAHTPEQWALIRDSFQRAILQGDQFELLRDSAQNQRELQLRHLRGAERMGRFD